MDPSIAHVWNGFNEERTRDLFHKLPGWYRAKVEETNDPLRVGRVRFRLPELHDKDTPVEDLPWAVPAPVFGGYGAGTWVSPIIGDIIWVTFEKSHVYGPIFVAGADPTRRKRYPLPSVAGKTPLALNEKGEPAEAPDDYDEDYHPKDNRPMSYGFHDRYGHTDIFSSVGFVPVSHKEKPAEVGLDAIAKKDFAASQNAPEINGPDVKYAARITKYGVYSLHSDVGYQWDKEFEGNFNSKDDESFEADRWKYFLKLFNEEEPKGHDQRRWETRTRYGHKIELRDVGWDKSRTGEYLDKKVDIGSSKGRDERWIKLRTKAGHYFQMIDAGSDPEQDVLVKQLLKSEKGTSTEEENKLGRDQRLVRIQTRYGFKMVFDDRGSDSIDATGKEEPRGNGWFVKGRRENRGFFVGFNEKDDLNNLIMSTPKGKTLEFNDKFGYVGMSTDVAQPLSEIREGHHGVEWTRNQMIGVDFEKNTYHVKLDKANKYIRGKTPTGQGWEYRDRCEPPAEDPAKKTAADEAQKKADAAKEEADKKYNEAKEKLKTAREEAKKTRDLKRTPNGGPKPGYKSDPAFKQQKAKFDGTAQDYYKARGENREANKKYQDAQKEADKAKAALEVECSEECRGWAETRDEDDRGIWWNTGGGYTVWRSKDARQYLVINDKDDFILIKNVPEEAEEKAKEDAQKAIEAATNALEQTKKDAVDRLTKLGVPNAASLTQKGIPNLSPGQQQAAKEEIGKVADARQAVQNAKAAAIVPEKSAVETRHKGKIQIISSGNIEVISAKNISLQADTITLKAATEINMEAAGNQVTLNSTLLGTLRHFRSDTMEGMHLEIDKPQHPAGPASRRGIGKAVPLITLEDLTDVEEKKPKPDEKPTEQEQEDSKKKCEELKKATEDAKKADDEAKKDLKRASTALDGDKEGDLEARKAAAQQKADSAKAALDKAKQAEAEGCAEANFPYAKQDRGCAPNKKLSGKVPVSLVLGGGGAGGNSPGGSGATGDNTPAPVPSPNVPETPVIDPNDGTGDGTGDDSSGGGSIVDPPAPYEPPPADILPNGCLWYGTSDIFLEEIQTIGLGIESLANNENIQPDEDPEPGQFSYTEEGPELPTEPFRFIFATDKDTAAGDKFAKLAQKRYGGRALVLKINSVDEPGSLLFIEDNLVEYRGQVIQPSQIEIFEIGKEEVIL